MDPGNSPVPRWMARLILSAGMFSALAAATAPRSRGLASTSPPPWRAAMVISLIRRVKILPRLASSAPFLCLIVAHFEWPDIGILFYGTADICAICGALQWARQLNFSMAVGIRAGPPNGARRRLLWGLWAVVVLCGRFAGLVPLGLGFVGFLWHANGR